MFFTGPYTTTESHYLSGRSLNTVLDQVLLFEQILTSIFIVLLFNDPWSSFLPCKSLSISTLVRSRYKDRNFQCPFILGFIRSRFSVFIPTRLPFLCRFPSSRLFLIDSYKRLKIKEKDPKTREEYYLEV